MPKFSIDTRKSEYSPIVVEINGTEYTAKEFDRETVRELNKYDRIVAEGDMEAPYRRLEFVLGLKQNHPAVSKLKVREVNRIMVWIMRAAYSADAAEMADLSSDEKKKKPTGTTVKKR